MKSLAATPSSSLELRPAAARKRAPWIAIAALSSQGRRGRALPSTLPTRNIDARSRTVSSAARSRGRSRLWRRKRDAGCDAVRQRHPLACSARSSPGAVTATRRAGAGPLPGDGDPPRRRLDALRQRGGPRLAHRRRGRPRSRTRAVPTGARPLVAQPRPPLRGLGPALVPTHGSITSPTRTHARRITTQSSFSDGRLP